jgi:hypothetical protein
LTDKPHVKVSTSYWSQHHYLFTDQVLPREHCIPANKDAREPVAQSDSPQSAHHRCARSAPRLSLEGVEIPLTLPANPRMTEVNPGDACSIPATSAGHPRDARSMHAIRARLTQRLQPRVEMQWKQNAPGLQVGKSRCQNSTRNMWSEWRDRRGLRQIVSRAKI